MTSAGAQENQAFSSASAAPGFIDEAPSLWRTHARALTEAVAAEHRDGVRLALSRGLDALGRGAWAAAEAQAQSVKRHAPDSLLPFRIAAMAREGAGDAAGAIEAYQAALAIDPKSVDVLTDLARLAQTMGLGEVSAAFLSQALEAAPQSAVLAAQLACALLEVRRFDEAVDVLSRALGDNPDDAALWNALGAALVKYGDTERGLAFLEHALTLAPRWGEALYNRAIAKLDLGDLLGCTEDCDRILSERGPGKQAAAQFVRAQARLAAGDLEAGWRDYEARLSPSLPTAPLFQIPGLPWTPEVALEGRRLLVVGEQGLGDEIMFSSMVPDLLDAVGPDGRLVLAVSPRLTTLFARSFPEARVVALQTQVERGRPVTQCEAAAEEFDIWGPIGSFAVSFRKRIDQFTPFRRVLRPDPDARAFWIEQLARSGPGLKVGISWKSLKTYGHRGKHYPPLELWGGLLRTPGVRFVNVQYGDCNAELALLKAQGASVFEPAELDRMNDLDGSLALSAALDLVIGVANASTAMAAAAGTPTWFILQHAPWPALGLGRHPWYPNAAGFCAAKFGEWGPVFDAIAARLSEMAKKGSPG